MNQQHPTDHTHESLDHEHPTSAGPLSNEQEPGTDIFGDETLVRPTTGAKAPGLAPDDPPHPTDAAHPRPTPEESEA